MMYIRIFVLSIVFVLTFDVRIIQASQDNPDIQFLTNTPKHRLYTTDRSIPVDQSLLNEVLKNNPVMVTWGDIFKIWGKNTLQIFNFCDCVQFLGIIPLPSRSRSSSPLTRYFEDLIGYAGAPLNFAFSNQPIYEESPTSMMLRGIWEKYNVEILRQKLVEEHFNFLESKFLAKQPSAENLLSNARIASMSMESHGASPG